MAYIGMNLNEVDELAKALDHEARVIAEAISTVSSRLAATSWTGADAKKASSGWAEQVGKLAGSVSYLEGTAAEIRKAADAQRAASASG